MRPNTKEVFVNRIAVIPFHSCWEWVGSKFSSGYGRFPQNGQMHLAHRYAFGLYKGTIPEDMFIMHSCDNKGCVNPSHLSAGTPLQNTQDMIAKGRKFRTVGSTNGQAKLNKTAVLDIRKQAASGIVQRRLAEKYNITAGLVCMILKRQIWGDV